MNNYLRIMKTILFLLLIPAILCGCIHHDTNVLIRPSAVPEKILTKTAIAPSSTARSAGPVNDPWKECLELTDSEPEVSKVSEIENEEFRRRIQITYMIRNEAAGTADIARRCMNGKLYVCGADDLPVCLEKLDFSAEPKEPLSRLCAQPELEGMIPSSAAIGWNSAYQWVCKDGEAVILRQTAEADAAGYDSALWKEIPAPE